MPVSSETYETAPEQGLTVHDLKPFSQFVLDALGNVVGLCLDGYAYLSPTLQKGSMRSMRTPSTNALTREEALAAGFIVDDTCYPWVAYKGPRFAPTEIIDCYTELEARLMRGKTTLIIADHVWGRGKTREAAMENLCRVNKLRRPPRAFVVYESWDEKIHVDDMGYICTHGGEEFRAIEVERVLPSPKATKRRTSRG